MASRLPEIADALGCSIDALFGREDQRIASLNENAMSMLRWAPELINLFADAWARKLDDALLNGIGCPNKS